MKRVVLIFIFVILIGLVIKFNYNSNSLKIEKVSAKDKDSMYTDIFDLKVNSDDNYIFLGDSLTKEFPLSTFFEDLPTVNSGNDYSLDDVKNNLKDLVTIYNPSYVIIELGSSELQNSSNEEVYKKVTTIVEEIKKERPKAKIYLESLYPTLDEEKNNDIKSLNSKLKSFSKENKIVYVDIYSHISNNNLLIDHYSTDGFHLTEDAYARISVVLRAYLKGEFNSKSENIYNISKKPSEEIIFVGDSLTDLYPMYKYFENLPITNNGISGYTTTDILDNMKDLIYIYNPSKVFITIGINDMSDTDRNQDEIYKNITKIVSNIKKNRPLAKIYVESIYPMNTSDDPKIKRRSVEARSMEEINYINNKLKEKYKDSDVTYIDMYSKLIDEEGLLKLEYTRDGVHLTNQGYTKISSVLLKYIAE